MEKIDENEKPKSVKIPYKPLHQNFVLRTFTILSTFFIVTLINREKKEIKFAKEDDSFLLIGSSHHNTLMRMGHILRPVPS